MAAGPAVQAVDAVADVVHAVRRERAVAVDRARDHDAVSVATERLLRVEGPVAIGTGERKR